MFKTKRGPFQINPHSKQAGVGFFGLIFYAVIFGGLGLIGLKSFPIYAENIKISRIIKKVAEDNPKTLQDAAASFERYSAIEDINSIRGTDLIVENKSGKALISYKYSKKIPLVEPVSLVFDFEGSSR
jgi:Domain of unknown function (DUF4845)